MPPHFLHGHVERHLPFCVGGKGFARHAALSGEVQDDVRLPFTPGFVDENRLDPADRLGFAPSRLDGGWQAGPPERGGVERRQFHAPISGRLAETPCWIQGGPGAELGLRGEPRTGDVDAPGGFGAGCEAQRGEGDFQLGGPKPVGDPDCRLRPRVPFRAHRECSRALVVVLAVGVVDGALPVDDDLEEMRSRRAGVEMDLDAVVLPELGVVDVG